MWKAKETSGIEKVMQTMECKAAVETLLRDLRGYSLHFMRMMHQFRAIKELKLSLEPGHLLLHVDFSENYSAKYHRETQSAHFGDRAQVVIHQGVAYVAGKDAQAFATLSDDSDKKAEAIAAHLKPIFLRFNLAFGKFDRVSIVSDSPTSQYRNRRTMYIIDRVLRTVIDVTRWQWIFTEAGHGKGAADGVGAAIKRRCDGRVSTGEQLAITTAKDVKTAVDSGGDSKIFVDTVTTADIQKIKDVFDIVTVSAMPGIGKAHHVSRTSAGIVYRELACLCEGAEDTCPCHQAQRWEPLSTPQGSVESTVDGLEIRGRGRGRWRGRGRGRQRSSVTADECAAANCSRPQGKTVQWVQCDGCNGWQHWQCAGITAAKEVPLRFFCSPECAAV
jgi:hypothetical protein